MMRTMRVAAIYDIHGNLPALEAVVDDIRREHVDHVVVGGDIVPGPMVHETVACLERIEKPMQFIVGNCEVAVLGQMAGEDPSSLPAQAREIVPWTAKLLRPEQGEWLASWPKTIRLHVPGIGDVLFCHGTPRDENEIFTQATAEDRLMPVFEGLDVAMIVCGHTHMQFDRQVGAIRVVNAGSVGMPFGDPGAFWLMLGPDVQLRCTMYDLAGAADRIRQTDYPQAQQFAADVLKPRTQQEILAAFSRFELQHKDR
jgi:putative phosphoesterase